LDDRLRAFLQFLDPLFGGGESLLGPCRLLFRRTGLLLGLTSSAFGTAGRVFTVRGLGGGAGEGLFGFAGALDCLARALLGSSDPLLGIADPLLGVGRLLLGQPRAFLREPDLLFGIAQSRLSV
jgi:hypothetical protein